MGYKGTEWVMILQCNASTYTMLHQFIATANKHQHEQHHFQSKVAPHSSTRKTESKFCYTIIALPFPTNNILGHLSIRPIHTTRTTHKQNLVPISRIMSS